MKIFNQILLVLSSSLLFSQFSLYNHPELEWKTIETEHFKIHFHQGTERSAREAATAAEMVYQPITDLYDFRPTTKTEIIIKDVDDYSNGSAYFFENMIEIWAKPLDYDLRGSHRWIQDVVAHEFTHIVQIGKSTKFNKHLLGGYIQTLGYEEEKREDVLYGYPNEIVSYPVFPSVALPLWLAEGTAQHMYNEIYFDYWDSVRDMLLRDRIINDTMFSFNQMNSFGKCGMGNELVYNFGYSLVGYISEVYGESALREISISLAKPLNYSINRAIKDATGLTGDDVYKNWINSLKDSYDKQASSINDRNDYQILQSEGITNINPRWSPSSTKIAYLSDKGHDYYGRTSLYIYSTVDSTHEKIKSGVKSIPAWINDSLIVYTKLSKPNKEGSKFFDLYSFDIIEEKEEQLTESLRLFSPVYDEENDKIIAINTYDGTSNLVVGNRDFSEYEILTKFKDGIQIYSVCLFNGNYLIDAVTNHERDLYVIDSQTGDIAEFKKEPWDIRDPKYVNNTIIYSDDKDGIYNLYIQNDQESGYITDLIGGAFKPDISADGRVVFSIYMDGGYKLAIIDNPEIIDEDKEYYSRPTSILVDQQFEGIATNYEEKMTGPFFFPRLMFDYGTVKPGFYFFDNEALRFLSILGGITYNSKKDLDMFLLFDYNKNKFSYYFNFYWMTRHTSREHLFIRANGDPIANILYDVDYTYHVFAADIGSRFVVKEHKFWMYYTFMTSRQFYDVIWSQNLPDEYVEDFLYGNEPTYYIFDDAYDFFRGHSVAIKYEYDARNRHYLYSMIPNKGYKINSTLSYEKNNVFEEFRVNEDTQQFSPFLANHDTWRFIFDFSKYSKITLNEGKNFVSITNNLIYNRLSNDDVNDAIYFYGGGLPGIKGYSYYEPTLQGPELFMLNNEISLQLFNSKADGPSIFSLSAASFGLIYQIGKSNNARIISRWSYPDYRYIDSVGTYITLDDYNQNNYEGELIEFNFEDHLQTWLDEDNLSNVQFDALDKDDNIPDQYESEIDVNVYNDNVEDYESMREVKKRYERTKYSIGLVFKLFGFSFYSYPTALTYECHMPYKDSFNSSGRHYIKLLFDF